MKAQARLAGFSLVGVARAKEPTGHSFYRAWIEKGYHGTMEYLSNSIAQRGDLDSVLPGVRSVLACAMFYSRPARQESPRIAQYALGRDYHKVLRGKLRKLGLWLESQVPGCVTRPCVDSAPILERELAQNAGLGWFGKNTCLINSERGSWFVLGMLLTTAELWPDAPAVGGCGSCQRCVEACPTGAIVHEEGRWQVDARRCVSYLTIEHRGGFSREQAAWVGDWTFGCDVCQEVCPFNEPRASQPMRSPRVEEEGLASSREWPSVGHIATIEEGEWDLLTRGSAVRRAGWSGLQRNARANLENAQQTKG
ncbi:MAG: tRNA epoxyqueuosine(34) reductase QueG [Fimbriimonadaceae bacterium]|nr:tRNA epoxyqueuosine(34) reductase QueG [Fimbriimonadaceae bacterium]